MAIYVIDAPMGVGKTSAMINYMREAPPNEHFVFVTPFLTESERIVESCPSQAFVSPLQVGYVEADGTRSTDYRSKLDDFKDLLRENRNISTTHSLFERFDEEARDLIRMGNYTLVMDEVCSLIEEYDITTHDACVLSDRYVDVDEDSHAYWREDKTDYRGKFLEYKHDCDLGLLWRYNRNRYLQVLPKDTFEAFTDCYVMTYLFEAQVQRCYFDFFGLTYENLYVYGDSPDSYHLEDRPREYKIPGVRDMVHIFNEEKLNRVGELEHSLTRTWYNKEETAELAKQVHDHACNFFRHKMKTKPEDCLWTCYKDVSDEAKMSPKGFKRQYLACNARATNLYKDRHYLAYLINLFPNPNIKNFLNRHGVDFDRDEWALSMMVQWIWRSAIRDGEEVWLYIPSRRMRTLLEEWLDKVNE